MRLKKIKKTMAVMCIAAIMAVSVSGCKETQEKSYKELDSNAIVLTVDDEEFKLAEAFFFFKWQQARYETMGSYYYGEEWYIADMFGNGESFQDYYKDYTIEILTRFSLARKHMDEYDVVITDEEKQEIDKVAETFMKENVKSAREAMMADKEVIVKVLTDHKILEKVTAKAVENVNTEISEEEIYEASYTKTYSYVYSSFEKTDEEGNYTLMSAAEQEELANQLSAIRTAVLEGTDFDTAVADQGLEVSRHTYYPGDETDTLVEINKYMDTLEIGNVSEVIPLDTTGAFIAFLDSDNTEELDDEEVINTAKENIISTREFEMFKEIVGNWSKDVTVNLNEDIWGKVTMEDVLAALS